MTGRRLAAVALIGVIQAGCGSPAPSETGGAEPVTRRDKAVRFAECMRDEGIRRFPDPDASGEMTIDGVVNGSSLDTGSARWKTAIAACRDLQPAGFTGKGARSASEQDEALAFARCIRANGVEDFPDPVDGEPLVDTRKIPSSAGDGMAVLNGAMQTCGDLIRDLVGRP